MEDKMFQSSGLIDTENKQYIALKDGDCVLVVEEGEVDLFLFDTDDRVNEKKGRYITTFAKGAFIFSPSKSLAPSHLFIRGSDKSTIGKIEQEIIIEKLKNEESKQFFYKQIVDFIQSLESFFRPWQEFSFDIVKLNTTLNFKKNDSSHFYLETHKSNSIQGLCFVVHEGSCQINEETSLTISSGKRSGMLSVFDKVTFLEDSKIEFKGCDEFINEFNGSWLDFYFQKFFLKMEKERRVLDESKKEQILKVLIEEKRLLDNSSQLLSQVLSADPTPSIRYSSDLLIKAAQVVAAELAIVMIEINPPSLIKDLDGKLAYLSENNNLSFRKVKIEKEIFSHDFDPLIVFDKKTNEPKVLLSKDKQQYYLLDPLTMTSNRFHETDFDFLLNVGIALYKNLDEKPTSRNIFKFVFEKQTTIVAVVVFISLLSGILSLYTPMAYEWIFDKAVPDHDNGFLLQILLGLLAVAVSQSLFQFARSYALLRLEGKTSNKLQNALWNRLMKMKIVFFKKYAAGDLFQRISAIDEIRSLLSNHLLTTVVGALFSFLYFGLMLRHSVVLSFIMLIPIILMIVLFSIVISMTISRELDVLNLQGAIFSYFVPIIDNIKKIRLYSAEARAYQRWSFLFSSKKKKEVEIMAIHNWLMVIHQFLHNFGTIIMYFIVIGYLVKKSSGKLPSSVHITSIGQFLSFSSAYGSFSAAIFSIGGALLSILKDVVPRLKRAKVVFDDEIERKRGFNNVKNIKGTITFKEVTFRYSVQSKTILNRLNLTIDTGSFIQIIGGSASGKSTILKLLTGMIEPTDGVVLIDGLSVHEYPLSVLRSKVGCLEQQGHIFIGSIRDNISCGRSFTDEQIEQVLELTYLNQIVDRLPMGLETVLPQGGSTLNEEEKRKIYLSRVLLNNPSILIIDDALMYFPKEERRVILEHLKQRHKTVLVFSTKLIDQEVFDHVYLLSEGVVTLCESKQQVHVTK